MTDRKRLKPEGAPLPGDSGIYITSSKVRIERAEDAPEMGEEVDQEFERFEDLTRKLVRVPRSEINPARSKRSK